MAGIGSRHRTWMILALLAGGIGCERARVPPAAPSVAPSKVVLDSALAGQWYPADPDDLRHDIEGYFAQGSVEPTGTVHALVLPHAGYAYSGVVAAEGLRALGTQTFSRVVVMGPSHYHHLENQVSLPQATHYGTPLGEVPLDTVFMDRLLAHDAFVQAPSAHDREHSVQIEVPLLQHLLGTFELVPLVVGSLDEAATHAIAGILRELCDTETLVIASTDFTHYGDRFGYVPFAENIPDQIRALDMGAWEHIRNKDARAFKAYCARTGATICGRHPIGVLLAMLGHDDEAHLLGYDQSGRMTQEYGTSVSYLAASVTGAPDDAWIPLDPLTASEQETLLALARRTVEISCRDGRIPDVGELDVELTPALREVRGAFVTLNRDGALRGCIGEIAGRGALYESVMRNAAHAALRDPRFPPVEAAEVDRLTIEISALTPLREVNSYHEFEPGRHGIVLRKHGRQAVYLPQVATEQGWSREETLTHLSAKAGLPGDGWRSGARFDVFEALVFGEHEKL